MRVHAPPSSRGFTHVLRLLTVAAIVALAGVVHAGPEAHHGAVAAEPPRAAEIGIDILRRGGNAVDAAIATAYAVCVLNASSCGIGGGGFMPVYRRDRPIIAPPYPAPGSAP